MTIEVDTVTLPSYWASALVNGDYSSLTTLETARLEAELAKLAPWYVVDVARDDNGEAYEPRFTSLYDPDSGFTGGEVMDYVIHRVQS